MKEACSGAATVTVCGGIGCAVACGLIENEEDANSGIGIPMVTKVNGIGSFEAKFLKKFFERRNVSDENKKDIVKILSEICKGGSSGQGNVLITRAVINYLDKNKDKYNGRHGELLAATSAASSSFASVNGGHFPDKGVLCPEVNWADSNIDEVIKKYKPQS